MLTSTVYCHSVLYVKVSLETCHVGRVTRAIFLLYVPWLRIKRM